MGHKAAIIGLIIAGAIWGISGFAAKFFIELGFSFIFILWLSNIFRFISVWLISDYKGIKHEVVTDIKELRMILLNGLFALFTPLFFLASLVYTTLSNAYFIAYTAPAWVLVGAVLLLGEKLTAKKVFGLALTILGLFFIANPESILSLDLGFVFSFIAALTYAGDIITSRELKDYPFHTVSIYANGFQTIVLTMVVPFTGLVP
ncbi:MAG: DMT family transporter, partial [archaeon]